ncbi:MAG: hypothetical protein KF835_06175 [Xanthobacteraceae bacterium]|jgi:hypothetical protein|nr:hypothetical protein [Xanthobacteraceae bacterium]MBX3519591.1 hypothetical protein [Xanthobacteraceae bacterium]MBX3549261.1 hypothetical protein [Xanthobacteraceae bacterium]
MNVEGMIEKLWDRMTPGRFVIPASRKRRFKNETEIELTLKDPNFHPVVIVVPEKADLEDLLSAKKAIKDLLKEYRAAE